jgi:opacity protein-like surface antigen
MTHCGPKMGCSVKVVPRFLVAMLVGTCCAVGFGDSVHPELGEEIDLSNFSGMASVLDESEQALDGDGVQIVPVDYDDYEPWIRGYVTGIVGGSFGTINAGGSTLFAGTSQLKTVGSVNETIVNGGGAVGMALSRPSGLLRMEVEGRARGPMHGQTALEVQGQGSSQLMYPLNVTVTNGWSAMTNFWRDYSVTNSFGVYGGGGFGVGGYQYSMQPAAVGTPIAGSSVVNTFAWQVGTGITYKISDRITFDTGYRFFEMSPGSTPLALTSGGRALLPLGSYTSVFNASELLLSIRIYEPFRNWQ